MAILYPGDIDSFSVPTDPENTSLSSSGTSTRDHVQSHDDLGKAIMALETNAAPLAHDHSTTDGNGTWSTNKLLQANTHQTPDTDVGIGSLHHTLGNGPTQAASGNHAHDYAGSSIFNKPLVICTSTTRPIGPLVGEIIWETDTNCARVWAQFPGNQLVSGTNYTYTFNSANNANSLDSSIFNTTMLVGTAPTNGAMGAPSAGNCTWHVGTNVDARAFARSVVTGSSTTVTDDQQLTWVTGTTIVQSFFSTHAPPSNDGYLRVSSNGQSYVRYEVDRTHANVYYTTTGYTGEVLLGGVRLIGEAINSNAAWTARAIGSTYTLSCNGVQLFALVDLDNQVNIGSSYRGWAIGMTASQGSSAQKTPSNVTSVTIADLPHYTTGLLWQLLPIGATPHIRAEAHFSQDVQIGTFGAVAGFDTVLSDWVRNPFMRVLVSQTDITVQESGHYDVHASICWDPAFHASDSTMVGVTVNGLDIGRKNWEFIRGSAFAPGFPQTNEIYFTYYFAAGDIVRVNARHKGSNAMKLFHLQGSPDTQYCYVELDFVGP